MRRATGSIVLNIAEGAGEFSKLEKARFYRMARRSALELSGALDVVERFAGIERTALQPLDSLLDEIAAMLTTIVKRLKDEVQKSREIVRERKASRSRS
jgi:four helix bundle protein